jgi:hypothetical protein
VALVTYADVQAELPGFDFDDDSEPNPAQVQQYIRDIEAEVQALFYSADPGVQWPIVATSPAAAFLRRTILEGVRWMFLRAKYALSSSQSASSDIDRARDAYNDRLRRVPDMSNAIGKIGSGNPGDVPSANDNGPVLAEPKGRGRFWQSANEWSIEREWWDERRMGLRSRPVWPF